MGEALVIEIHDLWKRYGSVDALQGIDLTIPQGSICGFLGRNGAGKSTTLKILLGMVRATRGRAAVFGRSVDRASESLEIRRRTGFVGEERELYDFMTVDETLRFTASFYPHWRRDLERHYVEAFGLPPGERVKGLSRGTRTKLALTLALARGAELLLLDEPTSGLDPASADDVLQALVRHAAREPLTVLFSSHQLSEIDQIADRVAILDRGRVVLSGGLDDIKDRYCRVEFVFDADAPDARFRTPGVVGVRRRGRTLSVLSSAGSDAVLSEARLLTPRSTQIAPVTLKEIFLETVAVHD